MKDDRRFQAHRASEEEPAYPVVYAILASLVILAVIVVVLGYLGDPLAIDNRL